jgi:hypothetical protein
MRDPNTHRGPGYIVHCDPVRPARHNPPVRKVADDVLKARATAVADRIRWIAAEYDEDVAEAVARYERETRRYQNKARLNPSNPYRHYSKLDWEAYFGYVRFSLGL